MERLPARTPSLAAEATALAKPGRTGSHAPTRRPRSPRSRESSWERDKRPRVPDAVPTTQGENAWGTTRRGPDRPHLLVYRYWKIGDDDTTMHEVDLSEDEALHVGHSLLAWVEGRGPNGRGAQATSGLRVPL